MNWVLDAKQEQKQRKNKPGKEGKKEIGKSGRTKLSTQIPSSKFAWFARKVIE